MRGLPSQLRIDLSPQTHVIWRDMCHITVPTSCPSRAQSLSSCGWARPLPSFLFMPCLSPKSQQEAREQRFTEEAQPMGVGRLGAGEGGSLGTVEVRA